jgi:hypothetical protein
MTASAVKVAVQPWSQKMPIEMSKPEERVGKMWAQQAYVGSGGMWRSAVWVEWMVLPSGSNTEMPGLAGCWWMLGAWMVRKWPVLQVSAMQGEGCSVEMVDGAMKDGEETETLGVLSVTGASSFTVAGWLVGVHSALIPRQSEGCCSSEVQSSRWLLRAGWLRWQHPDDNLL